jgi:hypothetical protein
MDLVDEPLFFGLMAWSRQSKVSQFFKKCFKKYRNVKADGNNQQPGLVIGRLWTEMEDSDGCGGLAPFTGTVVWRNPSLVATQLLLRRDTIFIFAQAVLLKNTFVWLGTHIAAIYR